MWRGRSQIEHILGSVLIVCSDLFAQIRWHMILAQGVVCSDLLGVAHNYLVYVRIAQYACFLPIHIPMFFLVWGCALPATSLDSFTDSFAKTSVSDSSVQICLPIIAQFLHICFLLASICWLAILAQICLLV